jgi:hypothetical protein
MGEGLGVRAQSGFGGTVRLRPLPHRVKKKIECTREVYCNLTAL